MGSEMCIRDRSKVQLKMSSPHSFAHSPSPQMHWVPQSSGQLSSSSQKASQN